MPKNGIRIPFISAALCIAAFLAPVCSAAQAAAETPPAVHGLDSSGIYELRELDPNLTGAGITFAVICRSITYTDGKPQNDYRPDTAHKCLQNASLTFHNQPEPEPGLSAHATAICSILSGSDANAFEPAMGQFRYEGAAPGAGVNVHEFWKFLTDNIFPASAPQADVISASLGTQSEKWWTRGLDSMAQHRDIVIVAGIGNGSDAFDPPLYPAAGSNIIGVGAVDPVRTSDLKIAIRHCALAHPQRSTAGPTVSGLSKPDIVAPGNYLAAVAGEPQRYEATGSWSSFATPVVAGAAGLLLQKANADPSLAEVLANNRNSLIKSILLNSATKLPYWHKGSLAADDDHTAPLDCIQGAGMLNPVEAYKNLTAGRFSPGPAPKTGWDLAELTADKNLINTYEITLDDADEKFITATAVWNKNYSLKYPFEPLPELDADLRLEIWAVDPNNPQNDYLLDYSDSAVDNLEHIYCAADANFKNYELIISYSKIDDPAILPQSQRCALSWNITNPPDSKNILWYDLNADGHVNENDLKLLLDNWVTSGTSRQGGYTLGDIDRSGAIDFNDVQILFDHNDLKAPWRL